MVKIILMSTLLAHATSAFAAETCKKAVPDLTPPERKMYARSISSNLTKWQPPAQIKVQKSLSLANWTAVWATPTGAEQGVFFFSHDKSGLIYHNVWAGHATASEKQNVAEWVRKLSPSVPDDLAECFADAVTANH